MSDELADLLSEECRLSILQGRFEALHQAAPMVEPEHIVLGVFKRLPETQFAQLFPDPDAFDHLCKLLSSSTAPAPVSPGDIEYAPAAYALVAAAAAATGATGATPANGSVHPLHLLLGAHALPSDEGSNPIAAQLTQMGISPERLLQLLPPDPPTA